MSKLSSAKTILWIARQLEFKGNYLVYSNNTFNEEHRRKGLRATRSTAC